jgi:hypothetical protein
VAVVVMALAIAATLTGRTVSSWTRGRNDRPEVAKAFNCTGTRREHSPTC